MVDINCGCQCTITWTSTGGESVIGLIKMQFCEKHHRVHFVSPDTSGSLSISDKIKNHKSFEKGSSK